MRKLLIAMAVLWCGLSGSSVQAQSFDTLQLTAAYNNGVAIARDTVFSTRQKIAIPATISVSVANVAYVATLRFIGQNDTLVVTYAPNGNSMLRTMNINADTVYASHLDFSVSSSQTTDIEATISLQVQSAVPSDCNSGLNCAVMCNGQFLSTTFCDANTQFINLLERATYWTSAGYAHYFKNNCAATELIPTNTFGTQTGNNDPVNEQAYAGISAYYPEEYDKPKANGFLIQKRSTPLIAGYRYVGGFSVSLADKSKYSIGGLGMQLSNGSASVGFTNNAAVTNTTDWQRVSGIINVDSNAILNTITIGNFGNQTPVLSSNVTKSYVGAYYYIDNIRLSPVPEDLPKNITACGNSIVLGEALSPFDCWNIESVTWDRYKDGPNIWIPVSSTSLTATVSFDATKAIFRRIVTIDGIAFTSVCTVSKAPPAVVNIVKPARTVVCTSVPLQMSVDNSSFSYSWSATQWLDNPTGNPRYDSVANSSSFYTIDDSNSYEPQFTFNAGGMYIIKVLVSNGNCSFLVRSSDTIDVIKDCCVKVGTATNFAGSLIHLNDSAVTKHQTLIVLGNPRKGLTYSSLPSPINAEKNTRYYVAGNIAFTASITPPQDSRFYVRGKAISQAVGGTVSGPYITVLSGTSSANNIFTLRGVFMRAACDTMWGGVRMNPFTFFDALAATERPNRIEDSYDGLCLYGTGTANENHLHTATRNIYRTFFVNNYRSIQFLGKTRLSRSTVTGGEPNSRAIVRSIFTSNPDQMKLPFHRRGANNFYFSYAHLSSEGFEVTENQTNCIVQNYTGDALYGMKLVNHKNQISVITPAILNCRIAGIWHTEGNLFVSGTHQSNFSGEVANVNAGALYVPFNINAGITLPREELSTPQIDQERSAIGLATSQANLQRGRTFGIYAEGIINDSVSDAFMNRVYIGTDAPSQTIQKQVQEPDSSEARTVLVEEQYNQIGYYGKNTSFSTFYDSTRATTANEGATGFANRFTNLRVGVHLEGSRGDFNIRGNIFTNNRTAIHIHRTANSDIKFRLNCNEFISSFAANTVATTVATTGLLLTCTNGAAVTVNKNEDERSVLGGCNNNDGRPNANEVRRIINNTGVGLIQNNASTGNVPMVVEVPLNDFTFINNQLPQPLFYRRWRNENVAYIDLVNPAINIKRVNTEMEN